MTFWSWPEPAHTLGDALLSGDLLRPALLGAMDVDFRLDDRYQSGSQDLFGELELLVDDSR